MKFHTSMNKVQCNIHVMLHYQNKYLSNSSCNRFFTVVHCYCNSIPVDRPTYATNFSVMFCQQLRHFYKALIVSKLVRLTTYQSVKNDCELTYSSIATPSWIVMHCGLSRVKNTIYKPLSLEEYTIYKKNNAINVFLVIMRICEKIF